MWVLDRDVYVLAHKHHQPLQDRFYAGRRTIYIVYSPIGETDAMHGPARRGNAAAAAFGCGVENLSL